MKWHGFELIVCLVQVGLCFISLYLFQSRKDHEKAEFEVHEVYAIDVLISSGEGKVSVP